MYALAIRALASKPSVRLLSLSNCNENLAQTALLMAGSRRRFAQYGCGMCAPIGWENFDCSPTLWLQRLPVVGVLAKRGAGFSFPENVRYGDIVHGLPLATGSLAGIYCSHVLEHLSYEDLRRSLRNTRSYLQEGGIFRLVLPDLKRLAVAYIESQDEDASCRFMRESSLGSETRVRGFGGLLRRWAGNAAHLWMWDYPSLARQLREAGFTDIRRAVFGDSAEPRFAEVENHDRWVGNLGIECRAMAG